MANETTTEVLLEELFESFGFSFRSRINRAERRLLAFFEINMVVELRVVIGKFVSFGFTENVKEWLTFGRNFGTEVVELFFWKLVGGWLRLCSTKGSVGI